MREGRGNHKLKVQQVFKAFAKNEKVISFVTHFRCRYNIFKKKVKKFKHVQI